MKPSWDDAPDWANWLAMDPDGLWYWFAIEPDFENNEWINGLEYMTASDKPDESGIDWDHSFDTLERRP